MIKVEISLKEYSPQTLLFNILGKENRKLKSNFSLMGPLTGSEVSNPCVGPISKRLITLLMNVK